MLGVCAEQRVCGAVCDAGRTRRLHHSAQRGHLVGHFAVAEFFCDAFTNHADINVASGPQVVENAGADGLGDQRLCLVFLHVLTVLRLKNRHGSKRSGTHCDVREFVCATVGIHSVQVRTRKVYPAEHESGAHVALVAEKVPLELCDSRDDACLTTEVQGQDFELAGHHSGHSLGVSGSASTAAPDVWRDVVDLLAVLVAHGVALGCAGVSSKHNAILVHQPHDGSTGLVRLGQRVASCSKINNGV